MRHITLCVSAQIVLRRARREIFPLKFYLGVVFKFDCNILKFYFSLSPNSISRCLEILSCSALKFYSRCAIKISSSSFFAAPLKFYPRQNGRMKRRKTIHPFLRRSMPLRRCFTILRRRDLIARYPYARMSRCGSSSPARFPPVATKRANLKFKRKIAFFIRILSKLRNTNAHLIKKERR